MSLAAKDDRHLRRRRLRHSRHVRRCRLWRLPLGCRRHQNARHELVVVQLNAAGDRAAPDRTFEQVLESKK